MMTLLLQASLPACRHHSLWQSAYVHLSSGLYVNALTNRLVGALWPLPGESAPKKIAAAPAIADAAEAPALPIGDAQLDTQLRTATRRLAPVWPLQNFVAVNPFLGLTEQRFAEVAHTLQRVAAIRTIMPRDFFATEIEAGRITPEDLRHAGAQLAAQGHAVSEELLAAALAERLPAPPPPAAVTVAVALERASGRPWLRHVTSEIGKWCAAYFDRGQATWRMPWQGLPLYAAWRAAMRLDRSAACLGLSGFAGDLAQLPPTPRAAIAVVLQQTGAWAGGHRRLSASRTDRGSRLGCLFALPGLGARAGCRPPEPRRLRRTAFGNPAELGQCPVSARGARPPRGGSCRPVVGAVLAHRGQRHGCPAGTRPGGAGR